LVSFNPSVLRKTLPTTSVERAFLLKVLCHNEGFASAFHRTQLICSESLIELCVTEHTSAFDLAAEFNFVAHPGERLVSALIDDPENQSIAAQSYNKHCLAEFV
jgi:hypothetical protein